MTKPNQILVAALVLFSTGTILVLGSPLSSQIKVEAPKEPEKPVVVAAAAPDTAAAAAVIAPQLVAKEEGLSQRSSAEAKSMPEVVKDIVKPAEMIKTVAAADQQLEPRVALVQAPKRALQQPELSVLESTKKVAAAVIELDKHIDRVLAEVDFPSKQPVDPITPLEGRKAEPKPEKVVHQQPVVVVAPVVPAQQQPEELLSSPVVIPVAPGDQSVLVGVGAAAIPVQAPVLIPAHSIPEQQQLQPAIVVTQAVQEQAPQPVAEALVSEAKIDFKSVPVESAKEEKKVDSKQEEIVGKAEVEVVKTVQAVPLVAMVSVVEPSRDKIQQTVVKTVEAPDSAQVPLVQPVQPVEQPLQTVAMEVHNSKEIKVFGGLGPLYLLASTLCNQTLEQPPADEHLLSLYNKRAVLRRSLFEYMSLKFTHLEKLSSKLNGGLKMVPVKAPAGTSPSHGWPVVGRCTAYDLRLMAEAAWCDVGPAIPNNRVIERTRRSVSKQPQEDITLSKLLYMSDLNDMQGVQSTIASLNLNSQEMQTLQNSLEDYKCRRSALKMTKTLFEHLAEDQRNVSETWPQLFGSISYNECARKRMIDVMNALAGFQGEASSIRRDNLEFAFAVDDLRAKVLESDLNKPLTFDKQFIEVEQFLQQSVRLMLANIDPERAKLTSMRYRSLMSTDDQCTELHQRLLTKNYPTDCNPIEFGQLPDVLRMSANSLELWAIEKEIGQYAAKSAQSVSFALDREVNECIANLTAK